MRAARFALWVAAWLAGCVQSPLVPCGDTSCPPGNVCTIGGCATPADVEACEGLADGDPCRSASGGAGVCQGGACRTGLCGNGVVDIGEICDGDLGVDPAASESCSEDCTRVYACGNSVVDPGEQCDDGNANPADGCDTCTLTTWTATTVVGSRVSATAIPLADPSAVAFDSQGRVFIADYLNHRVLRVDPDGSIETLAGNGAPELTGDGGPATSAQLAFPGGIAVDGIGRVFIADSGNHVIRMIDVDGTIRTVAGIGVAGYSPQDEGRPAILAMLNNPLGVAIDGLGRIVIADSDNHRVRRIDVDGRIVTIAGTGSPGFSGDGGLAVDAKLQGPYGVAIDPQGRVVLGDALNFRVRRIELDGTIDTIAGTGVPGSSGDGGPATAAQLTSPTALAVDSQGRVLVVDSFDHRVRRIELDDTITTIAGTGTPGFSGDGGAATAAQLTNPSGIAAGPQDRVAIADTKNQRIREVAGGTISTLAGSGSFGLGGDGAMATSAKLTNLYGVYVDSMGRIVVPDVFSHRIRRVEVSGVIATIAGAGTIGLSGDGGPATQAQLAHPRHVTEDPQGRIVFTDGDNYIVRRIEADGTLTRIAGTGVYGYSGDGGPAIDAQFATFWDLAYDSQGRLLIADTYNSRIRRIDLDGIVTTIAGNGAVGYNGDGIAATAASLNFPNGLTIDDMDRVIIADTGNQRIRRIELDGTITTLAGIGTAGFNGDGLVATSTQIHSPHTARIDAQGRVVFSDTGNHRVRRIEADGTVTTIAGTGVEGADGDAAPATSAQLAAPTGLAIDAMGRVLVSDSRNARVRRIELDGTIRTIVGRVAPDLTGPVANARLANPLAFVETPSLTYVAGGASGTLEVIRDGRVEAVAGRYPQAQPTGMLARYRTHAFGSVGGVAVDQAANRLYITETSANRLHVITQVDPADPETWTIATLANASGDAGFADGAAATARFRQPTGLYLDTQQNQLYIADTNNHAVRVLDLATNTVSTLVNTRRIFGYGGDGGAAADALLYRPTAITRCANGDLFIADTGNHRVRRVVAAGTISTVLGDGVFASSGEGSPAHAFPVAAPQGVACDATGNVLVTSSSTVRLLAADDAGVVDGNGPVLTIYGAPPRTTFPSSVTSCLTGIASSGPTTVRVSDACTGLLVELERVPAP